MSEELRLSKSCTEMFQKVLEETQKLDFDSVNIPTLLLGVVYATTPDGDTGPLLSYIYKHDIYPSEVDDNLSLLITSHATKLQQDYEEAQESAKKAKQGFKKKSKKKNSADDTIPMIKELVATFTFTDYDGKKLSVGVNSDVADVFAKLFDIVKQYSITELDPVHITLALFQTDKECFKDLFTFLDLNYLDAKKSFKPEQIFSNISFNLSGFMHVFNKKVNAKKPCEILCRDEETEQLWNIMLKKNKRNAVIVGEPGVGKTALVEKITYDIESGSCPPKFKNFRVTSLDVNSMIAGTTFRGDAEGRIKDIIAFLEKNDNVILFIDEVHTILGAGSCAKGEMDLANALKPILARGDTIVIGATTENEYNEYFKKDGALDRRFEKVTVDEPSSKDVYPMIRNKLASLSEFHGVQISKDMVTYAIMIAHAFNFEKKNPDKTLDLVDRAMVTAKRAGKSFVDQDSVLKNFAIYFRKWKKMDDFSRRAIAYHESGHYICGKSSGRLIDFRWLAISIMPAEDYLGVTVHEHNKEVVPFTDYNYYVDLIAMKLSGRAAEAMFTGTYTDGASADLESATKIAHNVVTKLGLGEDSLHNRIYLNNENYPMYSEKATEIINQKVDDLVDKSYKRACELLDENKDLLEALVDVLMERHIMSEDELDAIWQDVVKNRKN